MSNKTVPWGYESWTYQVSQLVDLQNNIKTHGLFFGMKTCFDEGVFGKNNSAYDIVNFWMLFSQKVVEGKDIVKEANELCLINTKNIVATHE